MDDATPSNDVTSTLHSCLATVTGELHVTAVGALDITGDCRKMLEKEVRFCRGETGSLLIGSCWHDVIMSSQLVLLSASALQSSGKNWSKEGLMEGVRRVGSGRRSLRTLKREV